MPVEVRVPPLGESVTEATVASWLKHVGDVVEAGEPLVELETDKVNVDVAAERSGVLAQIVHDTGDIVQPGDILAMVSEMGAAQETDGQAPVQASGQGAAADGSAGSGPTARLARRPADGRRARPRSLPGRRQRHGRPGDP
jgi:2-oxoglutarate dehydrogenase E2 component (dihydrolipoamide succinyltransferase)